MQNVQDKIDHAPVFDLCNAREKRFLDDLMREAPLALDDHPLPELHALLLALERMWGGERTPSITVPPGLMYYLVVYAMMAHHIPQDVEGWRRGAGHEVHAIPPPAGMIRLGYGATRAKTSGCQNWVFLVG